MDPDWIHSVWTRHQCTLDDTSYNQFRELLILFRHERDLEKGRTLAFRAAALLLLAKKVDHLVHIFALHQHHFRIRTVSLLHEQINQKLPYDRPRQTSY